MMATTTSTDSTHSQPRPVSLRGRDGFFSSVYRFFDGLGKNTRGLWVALAALVVIGAAISLYSSQREARSDDARNALFRAQKAYESEMKALAGVKDPAPPAPEVAEPPKGADAKTLEAAKKAKEAREAAEKARRAEDEAASKRLEALSFQKFDIETKLPESVKGYRAVIDQFGGTRAAFEARLGLGDLYYNHGDAAKATLLYKEASESAPSQLEKALAFSALGYAHEKAGAPAEAIAVFEKALAVGEAGLKGDLLLAIARCHEALNDSAKARSTYDQIISQLPDTDAARTAESLKGQLPQSE